MIHIRIFAIITLRLQKVRNARLAKSNAEHHLNSSLTQLLSGQGIVGRAYFQKLIYLIGRYNSDTTVFPHSKRVSYTLVLKQGGSH
jgi:hypothetical protein